MSPLKLSTKTLCLPLPPFDSLSRALCFALISLTTRLNCCLGSIEEFSINPSCSYLRLMFFTSRCSSIPDFARIYR